jgi:hypothetical protein
MRMRSVLAPGVLGMALAAGGCGTASSGAAGTAGTSGVAGTTGVAGTVGTAGVTGSAGVTGLAGVGGPPASLGDCPVFPADDEWNKDVSGAPVDATWTQRLMSLVGGTTKIHPDFGADFGIPINVVPPAQQAVVMTFDDYPDESDPGPYPFPNASTVMIEGGAPTTCAGDCHVLVVQTGACMLYEGYGCKITGGSWHCANGAKWDLKKVSYGQRPKGWTSADAAGLPIMPGILRYAEAAAGIVKHAVRFTVKCTTNKFVKPATHQAVPTSKTPPCDPDNPNPLMPPMGLRVRLKASYDTSKASPVVKNILQGLQHYGMILADNGSNFFFQGDPNPGWTNDDLDQLKAVTADAFEVVGPVPPLEQ